MAAQEAFHDEKLAAQKAEAFQHTVNELVRTYGSNAPAVISDTRALASFMQGMHQQTQQKVASDADQAAKPTIVATYPAHWTPDQCKRAEGVLLELQAKTGNAIQQAIVLPNYETYASGAVDNQKTHVHGVVANVKHDTPVKDVVPLLQGLATCTLIKRLPEVQIPVAGALENVKNAISAVPSRHYNPVQVGDDVNVQTWDLNWSGNAHNSIGVYIQEDGNRVSHLLAVRAQSTPQVQALLTHAIKEGWSIGKLASSQSYRNTIKNSVANSKWVMDCAMRGLNQRNYETEVDASQPTSAGHFAAPRLAIPDAQSIEGSIQCTDAKCTIYSGAIDMRSLVHMDAPVYTGHMHPLRVLTPANPLLNRACTVASMSAAKEYAYPGEARRDPLVGEEYNAYAVQRMRITHVGAGIGKEYTNRALVHKYNDSKEYDDAMRQHVVPNDYKPLYLALP